MGQITAYDDLPLRRSGDVTETTLARLVADARSIDLRSFEPSAPPVPPQHNRRTDVVIPEPAIAAAGSWD